MADERAIDYIQQQRGFHVADADIKEKAILGGFSEEEIDEAFVSVGGLISHTNDAADVSTAVRSPSPVQPTYAPPIPVVQTSAVATVSMGKFRASRLIVKESWAILREDEELAWFPVIAAVVIMIAIAIMAVLFYLVLLGGHIENLSQHSPQASVEMYGVLFVYYLVTFFIANYFQAAMLVIVDARFHGNSIGFGGGIAGANRKLGRLFEWSLISATVGVILQVVEGRGKMFGAIVASILGAAWNILTYFSLPALVVADTSVTEAFQESAAAIRKTWGESIIVNFGVGLFIGVLIVAVGIIAIIASILIQTPIAFAIIGGLYLVFAIVVSIISTTLGVIFKLALFEYAKNGTVPAGFTPELVRGAIKSHT